MEPEQVIKDVKLEVDDDFNLQDQQQKLALQNHVIMMNVGKYLNSTDLASARLTCKSWNGIMKHYQTIKLTKHNLQEFLLATVVPATDEHNLQVGQEFSNYHIYDVSFNDENVTSFFHKYGKFMNSLKITINDGPTQLNSRQFKQNIMMCTPNLADLVIEYVRNYESLLSMSAYRAWNRDPIFSSDDDEEEFQAKIILPALKQIKLEILEMEEFQSQDFLTDLLNAGVNVKSLHIYNPLSDFTDREIQPNSSILSALRNKSQGLEKLKKLDLQELTSTDLQALVELSSKRIKPLRLNHLDFSPCLKYNADFSNTIFAMEKLLKLQGNSLKTLSLYTPFTFALMDSLPGGLILNLPPMPQLQTLNLTLDFVACKLQFTNGSYLANFPNLTKLSYSDNMSSPSNEACRKLQKLGWEQIMPYSYPSPLVTHLYAGFITSSKQLYKLAELFPNLTKLQLVITSYKLVQEIWPWNKWRNLEGLEIRFNPDYGGHNDEHQQQSQLIDEYITGIPKEFHDECVRCSYHGESWTQYKTKPGIYDLKNLRQLKLNLLGGIHDISAVCGFASSNSKLLHLIIQNAKFISSEYREVIKNNLGPQSCILFEEDFVYA